MLQVLINQLVGFCHQLILNCLEEFMATIEEHSAKVGMKFDIIFIDKKYKDVAMLQKIFSHSNKIL